MFVLSNCYYDVYNLLTRYIAVLNTNREQERKYIKERTRDKVKSATRAERSFTNELRKAVELGVSLDKDT